ncbi:hypothetical protein Nepgr_028322 [Nepenthes gracilis]|uniref:Uncharacterized protein n=1 Tax=Nepenthes gracilis TaxID=150966 RepID=A0AAD3TCM2_NEPGR|nr:hypothetical protein Nepgr_028322 [Nepenthes gracilis]
MDPLAALLVILQPDIKPCLLSLFPCLWWILASAPPLFPGHSAGPDSRDECPPVNCLEASNKGRVEDESLQVLLPPCSPNTLKPGIEDCQVPKARSEAHLSGDQKIEILESMTFTTHDPLINQSMPLGKGNISMGSSHINSSTAGVRDDLETSTRILEPMEQDHQMLPINQDNPTRVMSGIDLGHSFARHSLLPSNPNYSCSNINKLLKSQDSTRQASTLTAAAPKIPQPKDLSSIETRTAVISNLPSPNACARPLKALFGALDDVPSVAVHWIAFSLCQVTFGGAIWFSLDAGLACLPAGVDWIVLWPLMLHYTKNPLVFG